MNPGSRSGRVSGPARIHAFTGFLGERSDWDFLAPSLPKDWELVAHEVTPLQGEDWGSWARRWLSENPRAQFAGGEATALQEGLLGYSLGGRAAFHLACEAPSRFKGLVVASAHPGLSTDDEKRARLETDRRWAAQFETGPWEQVLEAWEAQPVFAGRPLPTALKERRLAREAELRVLAPRQLTQLSLGRQENLWPRLEASALPQVWLAGERDTRYKSLVRSFTAGRFRDGKVPSWFAAQVVPGAGHRWPWELETSAVSHILIHAFREFIR